jgi:hypothetical protein
MQATTTTTTTPRPTPYPDRNEGTRQVKFKKTELTEIVERTIPFKVLEAKLINITAMKEYEDMSVEELRFYDYKNGLRFPSGGVPTTTKTNISIPIKGSISFF